MEDLRLVDVHAGVLTPAAADGLSTDLPRRETDDAYVYTWTGVDEDDMMEEGVETVAFTVSTAVEKVLGEGRRVLVVHLRSGAVIFDVQESRVYTWSAGGVLKEVDGLIVPDNPTLRDLGVWGGVMVCSIPADGARLGMVAWSANRGHTGDCVIADGCGHAVEGTGLRNVWRDAISPFRGVPLLIDDGDRFVGSLYDARGMERVVGCCGNAACIRAAASAAAPRAPLVCALLGYPDADAVDVEGLIRGDYTALCPPRVHGPPCDGGVIKTSFPKNAEFGLLLKTQHEFALAVGPESLTGNRPLYRIPLVNSNVSTITSVMRLRLDACHMSLSGRMHWEPHPIVSHTAVPPGSVWYVYTHGKEVYDILDEVGDGGSRGQKKKRKRSSSRTGKGKGKGKGPEKRAYGPMGRRVESSVDTTHLPLVTRRDVATPALYAACGNDVIRALMDGVDNKDWRAFGELRMRGETCDRAIFPNFHMLANGYDHGDVIGARSVEGMAPFFAGNARVGDVRFGGAVTLEITKNTTFRSVADMMWRRMNCAVYTTFKDRVARSKTRGNPVIQIWPARRICLYVFAVGETKTISMTDVRCFLVMDGDTFDVWDVSSDMASALVGRLAEPSVLWEFGSWKQHRTIANSDGPLYKYIGRRLGADGFMYGGCADGEDARKAPRVRKKVTLVADKFVPEKARRRSGRQARSRGNAALEAAPVVVDPAVDMLRVLHEKTREGPTVSSSGMRAIAGAIMGRRVNSIARPFLVHLAMMVYEELPESVREYCRGDGVPGADSIPARFAADPSVEGRMRLLADAMNLRELLRPVVGAAPTDASVASAAARWSQVCKAAGVPVEDALDINIMLQAKMHVRILVDTLLDRLGVGAADLLAARLETAGVDRRFSGKALFGSQLEWVDVEVDEDTILHARVSCGTHLLAVGEMDKGKTTFWSWLAFCIMKSYPVSDKQRTHQTEGIGSLLGLVETLYGRCDATEGAILDAAAERLERMARVRRDLTRDVARLQDFVREGMGLGTVGEGVTGTTQVLTSFSPGTLGAVEVIYQLGGVEHRTKIAIDSTDVDLLCATIAELLRVINSGRPRVTHDKIVRFIVQGPFPVDVTDTPGMNDVNAAVDILVQSAIGTNGTGHRVVHMTQVTKAVDKFIHESRMAGDVPDLVCSANKARSGAIKLPLELARSKDYVEMRVKQERDYAEARGAIRGDGFVSLWASVCRFENGVSTDLLELAEEARASQVAETFDMILRPMERSLRTIREWAENYVAAPIPAADALGASWSGALKRANRDASKFLFDALKIYEGETSVRHIVVDMLVGVARVYGGGNRWPHRVADPATLQMWERAQALMERGKAANDYERGVMCVVDRAITRIVLELYGGPDSACQGIVRAAASLSQTVAGVADLAERRAEGLGAVVRSLGVAIVSRAFDLGTQGVPGVDQIVEALEKRVRTALVLLPVQKMRQYVSEESPNMLEELLRPVLWDLMQKAGTELLWHVKNGVVPEVNDRLKTALLNHVAQRRTFLAGQDRAQNLTTDIHLRITRIMRSVVSVGHTIAATVPLPRGGSPVVINRKMVAGTHSTSRVTTRPMDLGGWIDGEGGVPVSVYGVIDLLVRDPATGETFPLHGEMTIKTLHAIMPESLQWRISESYPRFLAYCDVVDHTGAIGVAALAGVAPDGVGGMYTVFNCPQDRIHGHLSVAALASGHTIELETTNGWFMFLPTFMGRLVRRVESSRTLRLRWVGDDMVVVL